MFSSFVKTWWWKAFVFNTYPGSQVLKQCAIKSSRLHRGEFQYHGQRSTNRKTTQNIQLFMELVIIITWFYCFFLFPIYVFIVPFRRTWSSNIFLEGLGYSLPTVFWDFLSLGGGSWGLRLDFVIPGPQQRRLRHCVFYVRRRGKRKIFKPWIL